MELREHFSEAWIGGYEALVPKMTNDEEDRHVLVAAIQAEAQIIVTFNLRHFRSQHLNRWNVSALHPQTFLTGIFRQESAIVVMKLEQQAADRGRTIHQLLSILNKTVPDFVSAVSAALA